MRSVLLRAAAGAVIGSLLLAGAASAATIAVTEIDDGIAGDAFGTLDNDLCSLREAIQATNTDSDIGPGGTIPDCDYTGTTGVADTITLSASTEYEIQFLDGTQWGDDANNKGDLDINAGTGLTIQGAGTGATRSTIDGNSHDRILHILSASSGPVTVNGVILDFGRAEQPVGSKGGGILNDGGNLTVTGSDFTNNIASAGGAGLETNGTATTQISNSSFRLGNMCCDTTTTGGGGIGVSSGGGGTVTITNTEIGAPGESNQAQSNSSPARGGGISFAPASSATLTVTDSRIVSNSASTTGLRAEGGGVYIGGATGSTVSFTRTLIKDNTSNAFGPTDTAGGGGVYLDGPGATFTDSWITGNAASGDQSGVAVEGAGIYNESSGTVRFVGTTISSNGWFSSGTKVGAGIYNSASSGSFVLLNSTVDGNGAVFTGTGGGLVQAGGSATIVNSTFAGNNAGSGGTNLHQSGGTLTVRGSISEGEDGCSVTAGTFTSGGFNLDDGTSCEDWFTHFNDIVEANTGLGGLQDNGGPDAGGTTGGTAEPIPTREPPIDANPTLDSDAIDRIDAASCTDDGGVSLLATDQRGVARPFDGDNNNTEACDSGAVEVPVCRGVEAEDLTLVGTSAGETLTGTAGPDVILGAGGNDTINGAGDEDTLCGNAGNDTLNGNNSGALDQDAYHGGAGTEDEVTFAAVTSAVNASLASGLVNGGAGGVISNGTVENLRGGSNGDILTGDGADNDLSGNGGSDTLDGQSNAAGGDTADFSGAPAITANLGGTATGQGTDQLNNLENLRGGSNNDNLTGDAAANLIAGGAGTDTITGLGGTDQLLGEANNDSIFARDGVLDNVNCAGDAADSVEADAAGVDVIDPSCESVSLFVPPTTPAATTPAPTGQRAAALAKCKKKKKKLGWSKKRYKKCKRQANLLPV